MRCWLVNVVCAIRRAAMGAAVAAALAGAGCYEGEVSLGQAGPVRALPPGHAVVADIAPAPTRAVDILFVIDNSDSMGEEQASLRSTLASSLVDVLDARFGGRPDLHVGVVSTDLGADARIAACDEDGGDRGVLQAGAASARCEGLEGAFLRDVAAGSGRDVNYQGPLDQVLGCMIELGTSGCGFEQPLEAMRRALDGSNPENAGFLRPDALLAVVLVSDEDDCSASDLAMFDPMQTRLSDPLGPLSSFRCFDFGVTCDQADKRAPGTKTGCVPQHDSPYMFGVQAYVGFLHGLKAEPGMVVVAGIFGNTGPVMVEQGERWEGFTEARLAPSCVSDAGEATPGVRLGSFLDGFPARHLEASICAGDLGSPLTRVAKSIADATTGSTCLQGAFADADQDTPGVQGACRVRAAQEDGTWTELAACGKAGDTGCFALVSDAPGCGHTETGLAVDLSRAADLVASKHVQVECRLL